MSLESPGVLSHLTSWLTSFELQSMRALSRNLYASVPRHTWELTVRNISSSESMSHLSTVFPNVWCLRVQDALLDEMPTIKSLVPWLNKCWKLRKLMLTRVTCISVFNLHLLAEELTMVAIRECYQVQEPAIVAPNLKTLVIEHCPMTQFHSDTSLPQLKTLSLSSRNFTALQAQHLIKVTLLGSPALESLILAGCSQLEQVLVDSTDLPSLHQLDLSTCAQLERVHVTSKMLEHLDLSCNDNLQYLVVDLEHVVDLDLSFLKSLTYLRIRSSSLRRLNLRGCNHLMPNTMSIHCPNLQFVVVQGTSIVVEDLNKTECSDKIQMGNTTSWLAQSFCPEEQTLWVAAKNGDLETLRERLARLTPETRFYAEWQDPVYGYSPLSNACRQGHLHCVEALVAYGVNCNVRDSQGNTPLHIATSCGKSEVVRLLLELSAVDYFAKTTIKGQTVLDIARQNYRTLEGRGVESIQCVEHIEKVR
ncbi:hypothetical protein DD237_003250 [Peronospora effusa]|uniref:Uncharacterized protein n=1 Tax=Peronospora effusa TaxID=542832 RepID=A0A3R7XBN0_9STRA|nr:hypothetical protein DD237_003250 [Peronospora effusa]